MHRTLDRVSSEAIAPDYVPAAPSRSRTGPRRRSLVLLLLLVPPLLSAGEPAPGVGLAAIEIADPVNGGTMPGRVFYPSPQAFGGTVRLGPYEVEASPGAPVLPGARPLVLISHGHGGSSLGHHDLATYLAAHGFVVAALEHPRDNYRDASGDGHPEVMVGRPIQVSAVIDRLLDDPRWSGLIDPERIGVAGFSNGGYTALLLMGAVPRFERLADSCRRRSGGRVVCKTVAGLAAEAAAQGRTLDQLMTALQESLTRWGDTADPRIEAAFVMAPLGVVFDDAGLAAIDRPVFLYYGAEDRVLLPSENAARIRPLIPTLAGVEVVPEAGHWVFLGPCSTELAEAAPEICSDPPGVDRVAAHAKINADALAFFREQLAP